MKIKKISSVFLVIISGLLLVACHDKTMISEIEANPSKFEGKKVTIAGVVENSYGVSIPIVKGVRGGVYKVDDGTGEIWVLTDNSVPSKGGRIGVRGKIQTGVTINGKNYGLVLIEENRKLEKR